MPFGAGIVAPKHFRAPLVRNAENRKYDGRGGSNFKLHFDSEVLSGLDHIQRLACARADSDESKPCDVVASAGPAVFIKAFALEGAALFQVKRRHLAHRTSLHQLSFFKK